MVTLRDSLGTRKDDPTEVAKKLPEHLKQDKMFPEKVKAEYQGILAWMVRGCGNIKRAKAIAVRLVGERVFQGHSCLIYRCIRHFALLSS